MRVRPWTPILVGEPAQAARRAVHELADALDAFDAPLGPSLADGHAGLALLEGYLARTSPGQGHVERMMRHIDAALEALAEVPSDPSLFTGFTGVGWTLQHLHSLVPGLDDDDVIDEVLASCLERAPWPYIDLVRGLVGFGTYALERAPHPAAVKILGRVLARLSESAERGPNGAAWLTPPEHNPRLAAEAPHGWYDLGLAHGLPGVIAMLARACMLDIAREEAAPLLEQAVRWLLAHGLHSADGMFPSLVAAGRAGTPGPARSAWCYGDCGIAVALSLAARATGDATWQSEALKVAHVAVKRPLQETGVQDAFVCHGAAGLGHVFNRIHHETGDEAFATAARHWLRRALEMRVLGEGLGGYLGSRWVPDASPGAPRGGEYRSGRDPGLLTGVVGVALVLLAATSELEPKWDRVLLLSS